MVRYLRRRLSRVRRYVLTVGHRGSDRLIAAAVLVWRPPCVHQKAAEERVKHVSAVLNIIAGACFGVGVITPMSQGRPASWQTVIFSVAACVIVFAARHTLRYIPEAAPQTETGHG